MLALSPQTPGSRPLFPIPISRLLPAPGALQRLMWTLSPLPALVLLLEVFSLLPLRDRVHNSR